MIVPQKLALVGRLLSVCVLFLAMLAAASYGGEVRKPGDSKVACVYLIGESFRDKHRSTTRSPGGGGRERGSNESFVPQSMASASQVQYLCGSLMLAGFQSVHLHLDTYSTAYDESLRLWYSGHHKILLKSARFRDGRISRTNPHVDTWPSGRDRECDAAMFTRPDLIFKSEMRDVLSKLDLTADELLFPFPTFFFGESSYDAVWTAMGGVLNADTLLWVPEQIWGNRSVNISKLFSSGHEALDRASGRGLKSGFMIPDAHKASSAIGWNPLYTNADRLEKRGLAAEGLEGNEVIKASMMAAKKGCSGNCVLKMMKWVAGVFCSKQCAKSLRCNWSCPPFNRWGSCCPCFSDKCAYLHRHHSSSQRAEETQRH